MIDGDLITAREHLFKALGDRTRLEIIEMLIEFGEMSVTDIQAKLGKEQNLISHHLSCLKNCGLVKSKKNGKSVIYSIRDKRISKLLAITDEHVRSLLESVLSCEIVKGKVVRMPLKVIK
ncbi:MAG: winged helix-turn-helix transcriptional regulator [Nitrospirae bacterium]|nr:winged helix-turn-helix transcriptional regulator [Nitrospirota bacterium]